MWQVGARTLHIVTMALVLAGVAWRVPARDLVAPMAIAALSGFVLLGIDLARSFVFLYQGAGVAVILKLAPSTGSANFSRPRVSSGILRRRWSRRSARTCWALGGTTPFFTAGCSAPAMEADRPTGTRAPWCDSSTRAMGVLID